MCSLFFSLTRNLITCTTCWKLYHAVDLICMMLSWISCRSHTHTSTQIHCVCVCMNRLATTTCTHECWAMHQYTHTVCVSISLSSTLFDTRFAVSFSANTSDSALQLPRSLSSQSLLFTCALLPAYVYATGRLYLHSFAVTAIDSNRDRSGGSVRMFYAPMRIRFWLSAKYRQRQCKPHSNSIFTHQADRCEAPRETIIFIEKFPLTMIYLLFCYFVTFCTQFNSILPPSGSNRKMRKKNVYKTHNMPLIHSNWRGECTLYCFAADKNRHA